MLDHKSNQNAESGSLLNRAGLGIRRSWAGVVLSLLMAVFAGWVIVDASSREESTAILWLLAISALALTADSAVKRLR